MSRGLALIYRKPPCDFPATKNWSIKYLRDLLEYFGFPEWYHSWHWGFVSENQFLLQTCSSCKCRSSRDSYHALARKALGDSEQYPSWTLHTAVKHGWHTSKMDENWLVVFGLWPRPCWHIFSCRVVSCGRRRFRDVTFAADLGRYGWEL